MTAKITIAICTYKRLMLLDMCLASIVQQCKDKNVEIIVVDNDKFESAKSTVSQFKNSFNVPIKYFCEPLKGLSHARNRAVNLASGDFVLFIDDDEYADDRWLDIMIDCQKLFNADVILGKVIYKIPEYCSPIIKESIYYNRKLRITGEKVNLNEGYTGNTLIRKSCFQLRNPPFLNSFNLSGGEDSDFINFLFKNNFTIIFCNEAIIYEIQEEKKLLIPWFLKRGYRVGYLFTESTYNNVNILKASMSISISIAGGFVLTLFSFVRSIFNPNKYLLYSLVKLSNQFGKIGYFFRVKVNGY